jgi:hypothetical protein
LLQNDDSIDATNKFNINEPININFNQDALQNKNEKKSLKNFFFP